MAPKKPVPEGESNSSELPSNFTTPIPVRHSPNTSEGFCGVQEDDIEIPLEQQKTLNILQCPNPTNRERRAETV